MVHTADGRGWRGGILRPESFPNLVPHNAKSLQDVRFWPQILRSVLRHQPGKEGTRERASVPLELHHSTLR